jgi:ribonuclease-3
LDGGLTAARHVFERLGLPMQDEPDEWRGNPKGFLQMRAQALRPSRKPFYEVVSMEGPSHAPVVTVRVTVDGIGAATATAGSKTAAEVAAAAALLSQLGRDAAHDCAPTSHS